MPQPIPFNIMTKPMGPRCNIACKYCYYLEKEEMFPDEKKFRMPDHVLETYIRDYIEANLETGLKDISFAWQGGEPTMLGLDYFRRITELQQKYLPAGSRITNALQTNGMLLDDDWGHFLKEHDFLIGISIDGPRKIHNKYRVDRAERGSFDAVMAGLEILQKHEVEHNALTVVHRENAIKGKEIYKFLKGIGIEYMQFIPIVERSVDGGETLGGAPQIDMDPELLVTGWSVSPRAYGKFLNDVFDVWFKRDIGKIFVQFFDNQLSLWSGQGAQLCVFAEKCGNSLALEHNGNLYSCDHYVYGDYLLGNITRTPLRDMVWSEDQMGFGDQKLDGLTDQCRACEFRFACNGGCPKHRFLTNKSGETGHNYFCESYTMFFKHAGPRLQAMAQMLAMGRPAADAANWK